MSAVFLQSCAHDETVRGLDEKLSQETAIKTRADLKTEVNHLIDTAPQLTTEQRSKLRELRDSYRVKTAKIWKKSLRLQAVLIADILDQNHNREEIELIKRRIKNFEDDRVSLLFETVRTTNMILGRWASANQRITSHLLDRMTEEMFFYR